MVVAEETPQAEETLPAVPVTETMDVPIDPVLLGESMQDVQETVRVKVSLWYSILIWL